MRRALLITLSLILALVGWSAVGAEDSFYVIPAMRGKYAPVPKTGQTASYATGDNGALQKGVAWPTPRFTINLLFDTGVGTVTDNLTGLIWMRNANAFGQRTWGQALSDANGLKSGEHGVNDGSKAGDWRLPNRKELESLLDFSRNAPALPAGHPFTGVESNPYWSSTTVTNSTSAWNVNFNLGGVYMTDKSTAFYVWCVRGGP
jgi:hypothetical protein